MKIILDNLRPYQFLFDSELRILDIAQKSNATFHTHPQPEILKGASRPCAF